MRTASFPMVTIRCFHLSLLSTPTLSAPPARVNPSPHARRPPPLLSTPSSRLPRNLRTARCRSSDLLRMCLPPSPLKMDASRGLFSCASVDGDVLMALSREGSTRTGQWRKPLKLTFRPLQKFDLFHQKPPDTML